MILPVNLICHYSISSSSSIGVLLSFSIFKMPLPILPSLSLSSYLCLSHSPSWQSALALSTGILWQKLAQQEYISRRCHGPYTLWELCQGLFSIIRSIKKRPLQSPPCLTSTPHTLFVEWTEEVCSVCEYSAPRQAEKDATQVSSPKMHHEAAKSILYWFFFYPKHKKINNNCQVRNVMHAKQKLYEK